MSKANLYLSLQHGFPAYPEWPGPLTCTLHGVTFISFHANDNLQTPHLHLRKCVLQYKYDRVINRRKHSAGPSGRALPAPTLHVGGRLSVFRIRLDIDVIVSFPSSLYHSWLAYFLYIPFHIIACKSCVGCAAPGTSSDISKTTGNPVTRRKRRCIAGYRRARG